MKRRRSILATVLLLGTLATQAAEPAAAPVVFRLSPDGNWLAALVDEGQPDAELVLAPLQPQVDQPGAGGLIGALTFRAGDLATQYAAERQWSLVPGGSEAAPWCSELSTWLAASSTFGEDCSASLAAGSTRQSAAVAWSDGGVQVAVGVRTADQGDAAWPRLIPEPGATALGFATGPRALGRQHGQDVAVGSRWLLSPSTALSVTASAGEWELSPRHGALTVDQRALEVGVSRGSFSGGIVGRNVRPAGAQGAAWNALDIGVSWRTPWSGELSVGAQNVVGRADDPAADLDEITERTPYVRYRQDL
jgi:hypothetical protein